MNATRAKKKVTYPLTLEPDLAAKVDDASKKVKLSKADVMRLSIDRGIDLLVAQLTTNSAA